MNEISYLKQTLQQPSGPFESAVTSASPVAYPLRLYSKSAYPLPPPAPLLFSELMSPSKVTPSVPSAPDEHTVTTSGIISAKRATTRNGRKCHSTRSHCISSLAHSYPMAPISASILMNAHQNESHDSLAASMPLLSSYLRSAKPVSGQSELVATQADNSQSKGCGAKSGCTFLLNPRFLTLVFASFQLSDSAGYQSERRPKYSLQCKK